MIKNSDKVREYYDEHTKDKLRDFLVTNPRVEEAWKTIKKYAPLHVKHILEIGCGIGSICGRMNRYFNANIVGLDISSKSIELANKLFKSSRVSFVEGLLAKEKFNNKFDLIILMDVYEHIHQNDREELHTTLKNLLNEKGRIILSFPTPHYLSWLKKNEPISIQPVDEDISAEVILQLSKDTGTELILYKKINVWHEGDYAHAILEKNSNFEKAFNSNYNISVWKRVQRGVTKLFWLGRRVKNQLIVRSKLGNKLEA